LSREEKGIFIEYNLRELRRNSILNIRKKERRKRIDPI